MKRLLFLRIFLAFRPRTQTEDATLRSEWKKLALVVAVFAACFYLPVGTERFDGAVTVTLEANGPAVQPFAGE